MGIRIPEKRGGMGISFPKERGAMGSSFPEKREMELELDILFRTKTYREAISIPLKCQSVN